MQNITVRNNDTTQVWTNADAIADHENRITSNTTTNSCVNLEDRVARLENPKQR